MSPNRAPNKAAYTQNNIITNPPKPAVTQRRIAKHQRFDSTSNVWDRLLNKTSSGFGSPLGKVRGASS